MELAAHRPLYEGHLAYDRTFQSPLLDYNTEPADYRNRHGGGTGGFLYCIDSLFANNKGAWHEVDHITHVLKDGTINDRPIPGHASAFHNEAETIGGLRREFAMAMIHGSHLWWFDTFGGWFDDPVIVANMKKMTAISERFPETGLGKARDTFCKRLCTIRRAERALTHGAVVWLDNDQPDSVLSFVRRSPDDESLSVSNLSNRIIKVRITFPEPSQWSHNTLIADGAKVERDDSGPTLNLEGFGYLVTAVLNPPGRS